MPGSSAPFAANFAAPEGTQQRIFERLVLLLGDEVQHVDDRTTARFIRVPAREALGYGIHVVDATRRIRTDHGIANGLQRDFGALLLLEHRLLCAFLRSVMSLSVPS